MFVGKQVKLFADAIPEILPCCFRFVSHILVVKNG